MRVEKKAPHSSEGLTNETREALISKDMSHIGVVLDALYSLGYGHDSEISFPEAINALSNLGLGIALVRRALRSMLFFKHDTRPTGGRPAQLFRLPSPAQVSLFFHLSTTRAGDTLPMWAYKSPKHYKKAVHFTLIQRYTRSRHGHMQKSIEWLANRLGVSRRTIQRYNAELREEGLIDYGMSHSSTHVQSCDAWYAFGNERDYRKFINAQNTATGEWKKFPGIRVIACKLVKEGWEIYKCIQHCNIYTALTV